MAMPPPLPDPEPPSSAPAWPAQAHTLQARNALLTHALGSAAARHGLVGTSTALLRALDALERLAPTQASVLLVGEPGTGKQLFARALHLASPRRDAPFVHVDCAAIPGALAESELFGHAPGAFTGARTARAGWCEQADGGSLFLTEPDALPRPVQARLLHALQQGAVQRPGATQATAVDVRLMIALRSDAAMAQPQGDLLQGVLAQPGALRIDLPTLRERPEDIGLLALHFLHHANHVHQRNVHLGAAALDLLQQQPWPGNIRALGQLVERLVLQTEGTEVALAALRRLLAGGAPPSAPPYPSPYATRTPLGPLVRGYLPVHSHTAAELEHALALHDGNQSRAARALGLTVRQFGYRLRKARG